MWTTEQDKIASVGVHLRRNVTSHGIGLNVSTDLKWFERIVACGLVGKHATSFEKMGLVVRTGDIKDAAATIALVMAEELEAVSGVWEISDEALLMENPG